MISNRLDTFVVYTWTTQSDLPLCLLVRLDKFNAQQEYVRK